MSVVAGSNNAGRWLESLEKERFVLREVLEIIYTEMMFNTNSIRKNVSGFNLLKDNIRGFYENL